MNAPLTAIEAVQTQTSTTNSCQEVDQSFVSNPLTIIESTLIPHTAFENASSQLDQIFRYAQNSKEPICLPIIGESRTGKSRSIETFVDKHKSYRTKDGMKIPILSVSTPSNPTKNSLVEEMLMAIGDEKYEKGKETVKTHRLVKLMEECGTRVVVIDEFQHFVDKGSDKVAYNVADWLKNLVEKTKVAIVVAGLHSCVKVLEYNEQLDGRFLSPIMLPRFDWLNEDQRDEFIAILDAFDIAMRQHFDIPNLYSDEMAFRFYCATGGLIGYLAKMLRQAVWDSVDTRSDAISIQGFQAAHFKAIRKKDHDASLIDPFSSEFRITPTEELLAKVAKIGTRTAPPSNRRGARRRKAEEEAVGV